MKTLRLTATSTVWLVGANKRIQLPENALLCMDDDESSGAMATLKYPDGLEGICIRVTSELKKVLADADEEATKKLYSSSLERCLDIITDGFDSLPRVDGGTPLRELRDLGPATDWIPDEKLTRSWIHHVNMKIKHPSLSVEKAIFPGNVLHLVLVLTQTW